MIITEDFIFQFCLYARAIMIFSQDPAHCAQRIFLQILGIAVNERRGFTQIHILFVIFDEYERFEKIFCLLVFGRYPVFSQSAAQFLTFKLSYRRSSSV